MISKNINLVSLDSELAKKVYDDLFSPACKEAGKVLGQIIGLVNVIALPFALLNGYTNSILQKNIQKYEEKIQTIPENDRISVIPELGVPILEMLTYYDNEQLSNMFLELLKKASDKNEVSKVHPKYIKIVESLSADEAFILKYIYEQGKKELLYYLAEGKMVFSDLDDVKFQFKENIEAYIGNLLSLGILEHPDISGYFKRKFIQIPTQKEDSHESSYWNPSLSRPFLSLLGYDDLYNHLGTKKGDSKTEEVAVYNDKDGRKIILLSKLGLLFLDAVFTKK